MLPLDGGMVIEDSLTESGDLRLVAAVELLEVSGMLHNAV